MASTAHGRRGAGGGHSRPASGPRTGGSEDGGSSEIDPPEIDPSDVDRSPSDLEQEERARGIVLDALTVAARTRAQLAGKLAGREVPEPVAERVLDRLEAVHLIDDEAFARSWVRSRHADRGLARRALVYELRQRGVPLDTIQEAVEEIDGDAELAAAQALVRRKLPSLRADDPARRTRRLTSMLTRKGYGPGVALRAVRDVLGEDLDDEGLEEADLDDEDYS